MSFDMKNLNLPSLEDIEVALDRKACATSLSEFVKRSWHVLEPSTKLTWGRILDVVCNELEQIYFNPGFQPRLLINIPPGTMKSMLCSVMFPAWVWTMSPEKSFTGVAHEQQLAIRDARKMRILVESEWYQARWPLKMASDANAKIMFENEKRGFRNAVPFRSMTGRRSDFVIVDDPLSTSDAESAAHREEAKRNFRETLPTRVNNDQSAIIIIMQRLHEEDTSGIILAEPDRFGYRTAIFPMRFESDRADPKDWRTVDGELLFPERFSEDSVAALERMLLTFGTAGQLQQRPSPRGGGVFKREWFDDKILQAMPNDVRWVRGYDLAAGTKKQHDFTSSALVGITGDNRIIIADVKNEKLSPNAVRSLIRQTAEHDGQHVRISIPQDPGQAGLAQTEQFRQDLLGYDFKFSTESGDKQTRALPLAAQAEAGAVYYVKADWNAAFFDQLCNFPNAKNDDMVDSVTRAFNECLKMNGKKDKKISYYGGVVL